MASQQLGIFVIAASVAAELHRATQVARSVSLTAKNARAIAVRAGQQTVGFKAITNFIDELAYNTIRQANIINEVAVDVSRIAVLQRRAEDAEARMQAVFRLAPDAPHLDSLEGARKKLGRRLIEQSESLRKHLYRLSNELEETEKHIRAADIIATTSKVEASQSGEFRQQLEVIANNIQSNANEIKEHLKRARNLLHHVKEIRR